MRRRILAAGVLLMAVPASAQDVPGLPGEYDTKLAINSIAIGVQQLSRGYEVFAASCRQQRSDKAAYWEDACKSTPQCGGGVKE